MIIHKKTKIKEFHFAISCKKRKKHKKLKSHKVRQTYVTKKKSTEIEMQNTFHITTKTKKTNVHIRKINGQFRNRPSFSFILQYNFVSLSIHTKQKIIIK